MNNSPTAVFHGISKIAFICLVTHKMPQIKKPTEDKRYYKVLLNKVCGVLQSATRLLQNTIGRV